MNSSTMPREACPFRREVIVVMSSGREVPRATKVSAMTVSGTCSACAIAVPLSTRRSAPIAIRAVLHKSTYEKKVEF